MCYVSFRECRKDSQCCHKWPFSALDNTGTKKQLLTRALVTIQVEIFVLLFLKGTRAKRHDKKSLCLVVGQPCQKKTFFVGQIGHCRLRNGFNENLQTCNTYVLGQSLLKFSATFFPNSKFPNSKFPTVTLPNFEQKSYFRKVICSNGQKFDTSLVRISCFRNVKLSNNKMFEFPTLPQSNYRLFL
jgi:hypothetical protein